MKKLLPLAILFFSFTINAQVGIGTDMPNLSSQLEIVASDRGILIPQVPLNSLTDQTTITNGNVESLLVFNTTNSIGLTPGYYYWYAGIWNRITSTTQTNPGIPANNVVWNIENQSFVYFNEAGDQINIKLDDITNETITSLVDNLDGTYTYISEDNSLTTIDVPSDVIKNISSNGSVYQKIISLFEDNVTYSSIIDNGNGTFTFSSGSGTETIFDANTTKLIDNEDGTYNLTNANGEHITINTNADALNYNNVNSGLTAVNVQDALDEIQNNLDNTTDVLVSNNDGTYTHTAVDGTKIVIDANTTNVTVLEGVYTFTDGTGATITSIDTNANAIAFDNTTNSFTATNVQSALEELFTELETGFGNLTIEDNEDGSFSLLGADGTTVLGTVSKSNLTDNADGSYTFTSNDGTDVEFDVLAVEVVYDAASGLYNFTDSTGAVIASIDTNADAIAFDNTNNSFTATNVQSALEELFTELETGFGNLTIEDNEDGSFSLLGADGTTVLGTVSKSNLTDNADGSYTFTSNDGTDVEFDVLSVEVVYDAASGLYNFTDSTGAVIASIDTNANAITFDNTTNNFTATNVQSALEELFTELETGFGNLTIEDNEDGSFSLLGADGTTVLGTVSKSNLTDNADGSYTFTSNDGTDVEFDVLSVEVVYDATSGLYNFTDSTGAVIASIDTNANAIAFDNTTNSFTATNVQSALEELFTELETGFGNLTIEDNEDGSFSLLGADGTTVLGTVSKSNLTDNADGSYTFTNNDGTDVEFDVLSVEVVYDAASGLYNFTDSAGAVIASIDTNANAITFDNTTNSFTATNVQSALEELFTELETGFGNLTIEDNEDGSFSLLGADGTTVLGTVSKSNLTDNADGSYTFTSNDGTDVEFDVLSVEVVYDATSGLYNFTDSTGAVIASIDTNADALIYDNTTSGLTAVNVQDALDEIQENASIVSPLEDNLDGTFTYTNEENVITQIKSAMPKFFYMPSIIIPTDASQVPAGETFGEIDLHQRYADQFGSGLVVNPGSTTTLPVLPASELDYYITWYDTNVFENVSVSDSGVLSYDVLNNADITVGSFMNIVFVIKP